MLGRFGLIGLVTYALFLEDVFMVL